MPYYEIKFTSDESATEMTLHALGRDAAHAIEELKKAVGDEVVIISTRDTTEPSPMLIATPMPDPDEEEPTRGRARAWFRMIHGQD